MARKLTIGERETLVVAANSVLRVMRDSYTPDMPPEHVPGDVCELQPVKPQRVGALAVIIGHTEKAQGAYSKYPGIGSEWSFNKKVAHKIYDYALEQGHQCQIIHRGRSGSSGIRAAYNVAENWFEDFDGSRKAIIELHNNFASPKAYGTEVLFSDEKDDDNVEERMFVQMLLDHMYKALRRTGKGKRGPKYRPRSKGERGSYNVMQVTEYPSVLTEGFFASNDNDCALVLKHYDDYTKSFVDAFSEWCNSI